MEKWIRDRCVCAPHNLSAGTRTAPIESVSTRYLPFSMIASAVYVPSLSWVSSYCAIRAASSKGGRLHLIASRAPRSSANAGMGYDPQGKTESFSNRAHELEGRIWESRRDDRRSFFRS